MVIFNSYVSLPEGKWFSFTGVEIEKKTSSDYKGDGRKVEHTVDCGFWRGCSAAQFWLTRISHVPNSSCGWWTRLHCKGVESFPTATNDGTSPPPRGVVTQPKAPPTTPGEKPLVLCDWFQTICLQTKKSDKRYQREPFRCCKGWYSYGPLPVISTYNPIYNMYNPTYNQL